MLWDLDYLTFPSLSVSDTVVNSALKFICPVADVNLNLTHADENRLKTAASKLGQIGFQGDEVSGWGAHVIYDSLYEAAKFDDAGTASSPAILLPGVYNSDICFISTKMIQI